MESNIFDSLIDLGFNDIKNASDILNIVENEGNPTFLSLVACLSQELSAIEGLEEKVHSQTEDIDSFHLELSSFLRELGCPYTSLTEGDPKNRLNTPASRLQVLDYLCTELQASKLCFINQPPTTSQEQAMEICESDVASRLKELLQALGFPRPPDSITTQQMFCKVKEKIEEHIKVSYLMGEPLLRGILGDKQWTALREVSQSMNEEYGVRAQTLLKRLDVTVQSFTWSDRVKKMENDLVQIYNPRRMKMQQDLNVTLVDLLAARDDLTRIEKTSSSSVRQNTKSKINKVLMKGRVPDRGGRPSEIEAPPPEMPAWQKDRTPTGTGNFGGRGGGRGRGGGGGQSHQWGSPQRGGQGAYASNGHQSHNYTYQQQTPLYQQQGGGGFQQYQQYQQQTFGGQQYQQQGGYHQDQYQQRGRGRGGGGRGGGGRGGGGRGRGRYFE